MNDLSAALWISAGAAVVALTLWLMIRAVRWAKKGTKAGSMLAAAAFPFPDQPPPGEQVENANRLKKDAGARDPNDRQVG